MVEGKHHPIWKEQLQLRPKVYFPAIVVCQPNSTDVVRVHCNYSSASAEDSGDYTHSHDYSRHACSATNISVLPNHADICFVLNADRTAFSEAAGFLEASFFLNVTNRTDASLSRMLVRLVDPKELLDTHGHPRSLYDARPSFYSWLEPGSLNYVLLTKSEDNYLKGELVTRYMAIPSTAPPTSPRKGAGLGTIRLVYQDNYVTVRQQVLAYTWYSCPARLFATDQG